MNKKWPAWLLTSVLVCVTCFAGDSRLIRFSEYTWFVTNSAGRMGPGPNFFSDSPQNVWVDTSGRLHLKIRKSGSNWHCSGITLMKRLGYGTYRFCLDSPVDHLDPNVVVGLFTWGNRRDYHHREIDIEFSRWSDPKNKNGQYVVQPSRKGKKYRFLWPSGIDLSAHSFNWQKGIVKYQSQRGHALQPTAEDILQQWVCTSEIPVPGDEKARMNLWLYRGRPPSNGKETEIIISKFQFVPEEPNT